MAHGGDTWDVTRVLRGLMAQREVSQRNLAERASMPLVTLNRRMAGNGGDFRLEEFLRVVDVLEAAPDEVVRQARTSHPQGGAA